MNKRLNAFIVITALFSIWLLSCNQAEGKTNISSHAKDESHYTGDNCLNCHYTEGSGDGWFSAAGSVFGNYTNHTVRLTDIATQEVIAIEIDQLGNLYITEAIDYTNGMAIDIINESGQVVSAMSTIAFTGQCNLCHDGTYTSKITLQ